MKRLALLLTLLALAGAPVRAEDPATGAALASKDDSGIHESPRISIFDVGVCGSLQLFGSDVDIMGVSLGLFSSEHKNVSGLSFCLGLSWETESFSGIQLSGVGNGAPEMNGLSIAGLLNSSKDFSGVEISFLLGNYAENASGVQVGGILNLDSNLDGCSLAGFNLAMSSFNGAQLGLGNFVQYGAGLQCGCVNISYWDYEGVQLGFMNFGQLWAQEREGYPTLEGLQVGAINQCSLLYGAQVGVFNSATEVHGVQVGLICHNASGGWHSWLPFINW